MIGHGHVTKIHAEKAASSEVIYQEVVDNSLIIFSVAAGSGG